MDIISTELDKPINYWGCVTARESKDFSYFRKIHKSSSSSIPGCPCPPRSRDPLWEMTQPLTSYSLTQLPGLSGQTGNKRNLGYDMFVECGRRSVLRCLSVRCSWGQLPLTLCVSEQWRPPVAESTASLRRSRLKCHQLQKTSPEDSKQKHACTWNVIYSDCRSCCINMVKFDHASSPSFVSRTYFSLL